MLRRWARDLDWIIWLDAPADVLVERIRSRPQEHLMKRRSDDRARRFLARYERAYERIVAAMTADGAGPAVLRVNSREKPAAHIADEVLAAVKAECRPRLKPAAPEAGRA